MPIYEYQCADCQRTFELRRSIQSRDEPASCPVCHQTVSSRIVSLFSAVSKGANGSKPIAGGAACAGCSPAPGGCAGCSCC